MASSPNIPAAKTPATKPERTVDVAPEDIQLGSGDDTDGTTGKKKLTRPRAATDTGLQV